MNRAMSNSMTTDAVSAAQQQVTGDENGQFSPNNLIVNYLPQSLTDAEFKRIFEKIGPVNSAKVIRKKGTNYSYGFGFVEYLEASDAQKAVDNLNGYPIENKKIKVAFSRPHSDDIKRAKLYVKNVPSNYTVEQLNSLFGKYGTIIQSRLLEDSPINPNNAKNKGIAFILFNLHEEAEKAIENLKGVTLPGAQGPLDIKFASKNNGKTHQQFDGGMFNPRGMGTMNIKPSMHNGPGNMSRVPHHNYRNGMQPHSYYENMQYSVDGYNYYNNGGGNANPGLYGGPIRGNFQYGNRNHNNRFNPINNPNGGQVDYSEFNAYDGAPGSNGWNGYGKNQGGFGGQQQFHPQQYGGNSNVPVEMDGLVGSVGFILFVYNIGTETNEAQLQSMFSKYGKVIRANVYRKNNESKGFGFVTMSSNKEANLAIKALNGSIYQGRQLQVSFKK